MTGAAGAVRLFPEQLLMEVTTRCQLGCVMCARHHDPRPTGDLPPELFARLQSDLPRFRRVLLTGHGEALLHPGYRDMVRAVKRAGCTVETTTNAMLLDGETSRCLVEAGLDELIVSLESADPEQYARVRRGADLAVVVANLQRLQEEKRRRGSRVPELIFNVVGMRATIAGLPGIVRLAAAVGAARIAVIPLIEYPAVAGESLLPELQELRPLFAAACRLARAHGIVLYSTGLYAPLQGPPGMRQHLRARLAAWWRRPAAGTPAGRKVACTEPWRFSWLTRTGAIRPCCVSEQVMGNLREDAFSAIWAGERYRAFRCAVADGPLPEECRSCQIAKPGSVA